MKNKLIFPLFFAISITTIFGCKSNDKKLQINILTKLEEVTEIERYEDLASMLSSSNNEDFMLSTYSKKNVAGCSCWSIFKNEILKQYVIDTHVPIYYFDTDKILEGYDNYGISKIVTSTPEFYLFKDGINIKRYKGDNNFFKLYKTFKNEIDKKINLPTFNNLYYVNENFLNVNLSEQNESVLFIERNGCPDCQTALPSVILPLSAKSQFTTPIYILDIQSYTNTDDYVRIKDKYNLSSNSNNVFGYGNGVVPTIQKYFGNELKDASVYFNDVVLTENDVSKIKDTYYTEERLNNLKFLKNSNVSTKILYDLVVPNTEVSNTYWKPEYAKAYHDPILKEFINYYCL